MTPFYSCGNRLVQVAGKWIMLSYSVAKVRINPSDSKASLSRALLFFSGNVFHFVSLG